MSEIKIITLTEQELEEKLEKTVAKALAPFIQMIQKPKEEPLPKSEIMKRLGIKHPDTFRKRVIDNNVRSCGKIGNEPAYYLKDFFKAA